MNLIDTHCHLYSKEFSEDIHDVVQRANRVGDSKFYLPAIDSEHTEAMLALEKAYPEQCFAMMGLHPCSVKENYKEELAQVLEWLNKRRFAAIGEIGLDFYWDKIFIPQQYDAFKTQMEWALEKNFPIVIHARDAMQETIDTVKPFADKGLRGIFHCFGGSENDAQQIVRLGFYLGIGGVLTYKKANLPEALKNISLENMVLETDAPYLSPVPFRGKRNESSYLQYIVKVLAEVKNTTQEEVAAITTRNAKKIFG
jgi:TatD DNase family protein